MIVAGANRGYLFQDSHRETFDGIESLGIVAQPIGGERG